MGDPLSIVAGVAGVTSLGIQVTERLVAYYTKYKNQNESVARTVRKLETLLNTLESQNKTLRNRQFKADEVDQVANVEIAVEGCRDIIVELQAELQKFTRSSGPNNTSKMSISDTSKRACRKISYPFRESTLQKLDEDIAEFRDNLLVALNVLQLKLFDDIQHDTADLITMVDILRTSQISQVLRDWLKAPDPTSDYNEACKRRHSKTGLWLVKGSIFNKWLEEARSFLWLHGRPGCGKTVLCSTAIGYTLRHRRSNTRIGIAFHYFTFSDNHKQNVSGLLKTLLLQLSSQLVDGNTALARLRSTYSNGEPPIPALEDTLKKMVTEFHDVYLIIDAIDESPGEERDFVLDTLSNIRNWSTHDLHILVTSRDEPDIRAQLTPQITQEVCMDNGGVDKDIEQYVIQRLEHDGKFRKFAPFHKVIENNLIKRADGIFRWVYCQFLSLASCASSQYHLEKALSSLPRSLDETYDRMLENICPERMDEAKRILTWICFSKRPVTVQEIVEALTVELGNHPRLDSTRRLLDPLDVIRACPGLIGLSTDKNEASSSASLDSNDASLLSDDHIQSSFVRIAHFSVQEYLESDRIRSERAAAFALYSDRANTELAKTCLVYLQNAKALDLKNFPLASYAAGYWYQHYRHGDVDSTSLNSLAANFLMSKDAFQNSIRIHDPLWQYDPLPLKRFSSKKASPLRFTAYLGFNQLLQLLLKNDHIRNTINDMDEGHRTALHQASLHGHVRVVQLLLDNGADVKAKAMSSDSALVVASSRGHEKVVQLLLDRGAEVDAAGKFHKTALHWAAYSGHESVVQLLIQKGAKLNGDAVKTAAGKGHMKLVQLLIDKGAEMKGNEVSSAAHGGHEKIVQLLIDKGAEMKGNEVSSAAHGGHEKIVHLLLDKGAKMDGTELLTAAGYGFDKVVQLLLERGAKTNGNETELAARFGHIKVVQLLIDKDAKMNGSEIQAAVESGNENLVLLLIDKGARMNGCEIAAAAEIGLEKMVQLLMDNGAKMTGNEIEAAVREGRKNIIQPLMDRGARMNGREIEAAASGGHEEIVQLLVNKGARFAGNETVKAARWGYDKVVRLLLDNGLKVDQHTMKETILEACSWGRENVVRLLEERWFSIDSDAIQEAIEAAARRGHKKTVQLILERHTNVDGSSIQRAIEAAATEGHEEVVQVLLGAGAEVSVNTIQRAIEAAAKEGFEQVVQVLLERRADADRDAIQRAIGVATEGGYETVVRLLEDYILSSSNL